MPRSDRPRPSIAATLLTHAALAGLSVGAAACASTGGTAPAYGTRGPAADIGGSEYVRVIDAIEVRDEYGTPYPFPFLGGFDVPRPQFVDIDADGDLDLFVQERGNALIHFENTGTPQRARFEWRTDAYRGLEIGEWTRFADLDGDGDYDVLGEEMFSYVRFYRNEGTPRRAEFVLAADSLRDPAGKAVFADRQNIPALADWDCDGELDLFIGRVDGTVTRYEEAGLDSNGVPTYRFVTDRFEEIEIVGQLGGSRHGANSMAFADVDGDGALDLFWGDFFEPGVLFLENRGSCTNPSLRVEPVPVRTAEPLETSGYNAPYLADIDADGDLDLFIGVIGGAFNPTRTAADNFLFFENDGTGLFTRRSSRYVPGIDVGSESIPEVGDLDGDGDLDILLANKVDPSALTAARLYWLENIGDASRPAFRLADTLDLGEFYHYAPALGDLDGDGALDLLLGTWNKGIFLYRSAGGDGPPRFEQVVDTAVVRLTRGSNSVPALGDVDRDGDLDLFVGESSGELNFYLNTGSPSAPEFSLVSDNFEEIDVGRRSSPDLADVDGDGDLDLVIGSESGALTLMRNETVPGGDVRFVLDVEFAVLLQPAAAPVFADIDGDGDLDLLAGGLAGGLMLMENAGSD